MWWSRLLAVVVAVLLATTGCCLPQQDSSDKQLLEAAAAEGRGMMPYGIQTCVDGFVVHKDKIIRTQDSKEMGAKYLTEIDVETRLDCMKACCETDQCDVFIFEEKVRVVCTVCCVYIYMYLGGVVSVVKGDVLPNCEIIMMQCCRWDVTRVSYAYS